MTSAVPRVAVEAVRPTSGQGDIIATGVARNSARVAAWTLVSRSTGFARAVTIAAVLGPTVLGNTFLATNLIPNVVFEFLTGSLLVSMLVPPLVRRVMTGDREAVDRLAGRLLGVSIVGFGAVTVLVLAAAPLILRVLTLGVSDASSAAAQQEVGAVLIVLLLPQVVLYGIAGVCGAVSNANGHFTIPAAAPAMENLGVIVTLVLSAVIFGTGSSVDDVPMSQLLLLGIGTTAAVGLHAATQWWGAWHAGVRLRPRFAWRDPEVQYVLRLAVPSLGYASLNAFRVFAMLPVANRVAGGVVAFQLALAFYYLPIAICARPVAVALLPELSESVHRGDRLRASEQLSSAIRLVTFLTVPAAVSFAVLAVPLAQGAAFGQMSSARGIDLLAASLAALSVGVLGEAAFVLATHVSYAIGNARAPFSAMVVRTLVSVMGMVAAFLVPPGISVLIILGIAVSAGNVASVVFLCARLRRSFPPSGHRPTRAVARATVASAVMCVPAYAVATTVSRLVEGPGGRVLALLLAVGVGAATYLGLQLAMNAPELKRLTTRFRPSPLGTE